MFFNNKTYSQSITDHLNEIFEDADFSDSTSNNDICDSVVSDTYGFQIFFPNTLPELDNMNRGGEDLGFFAFQRDFEDCHSVETDYHDLNSIKLRISNFIHGLD